MSDRRVIHLHLISDSTGETIHQVARACLVQFEGVEAVEHAWSLVRTPGHVDKVVRGIEAHPGVVLFTLVDDRLRRQLEAACARLRVPSIPVLDPVLAALARHLELPSQGQPGRQHALDAAYFARIAALDYTMIHDDGQHVADLDEADVILVGVSRTSKTPTAVYLAHRGLKVANVPIVPGMPLPPELFAAVRPFIIGLTTAPERLIEVRQQRILMLSQRGETAYVDEEAVRREVADARRLFHRHGWPVIDITRRSVEETAAAILQLYHERTEAAAP